MGQRLNPLADFTIIAGTAGLIGLWSSSAIGAQSQDRKSGSGFAVDAAGKLLTNSHVVDGCSDVTAINSGRGTLNGHVLARDPRNDLALIAVDTPLGSVAAFRRFPIRAGDDVVALGFPLRGLLAEELNVSKGIVSATAGLLNDTSQLQISAAVQPGNSGGPLLDSSGLVSGIVVSKLDAIAIAQAIGDIPQNINFAIKAEMAQVFLRSQGVEPRLGAAAPQALSAADVVQSARSYTFVIECDPGRLTRLQQAQAERRAEDERQALLARQRQEREDAEKRAAERRAEDERQALLARQRREREDEEKRAAQRRAEDERQTRAAERHKADEENNFWESHDIRKEQCVRPSSVIADEWSKMTARQQWDVCSQAGTITRVCPECASESGVARRSDSSVLVVDAGFSSREVDVKKVASGAYRNTFDQNGRWMSMFARVVGLSEGDDVYLSVVDPKGKPLYSANLKVKRDMVGDTVFKVGKRRAVLRSWEPGLYTGEIRAVRRGREILKYSARVEIHK